MRFTRTVGVLAALTTALGSIAACSSSGGGSSTEGTTTLKTTGAGAAHAAFGKCTLSGTFGAHKLKTVTKDTLTIKADLPSAGWFNGDTIAQIDSGYEYCLAADIAYQAGLHHLKLINVSFDQLVSGRLTGYDLSLDEISITPERQKVVDFSAPYYQSAIGVLARTGSKVTAQNIRSMHIGVKQGTAAQQWVQDTLKPTGQADVFPGDTEALAAVNAGRIDAYLQDTAIELGQAKQSGGKVAVVGQYHSGQDYGAMFPKNSPNVSTVDQIIAGLQSDGTLGALSKTYLGPAFGGDPATIPVWTLP
jgi:polar amino acid transport system substrate-binding protein